MKKILGVLMLLVALFVTACELPGPTNVEKARQEVDDRVGQRSIYVPKNDLEFKNYNRRQQVADDPTTILWCTSAFPVPSSALFTVPVVGKLTSGSKRPYATAWNTGDYSGFTEKPGPDGMYGASGEYRYGFTPAGPYVDFYNLATFCTTEPTVWQRESTDIVLRIDPTLSAAHEQARELLRQGKPVEANKILEQAIKGVQK